MLTFGTAKLDVLYRTTNDDEESVISRARPTLNLPCISPQNSVTCNGEYRRPVIKAQPSFHGVLTYGVIFSTLKHRPTHRSR